ncbi:unnamed protein product [Schistosoma curassoni]|uniref:Uncharacterized protein n=1 Tax=Schistosoma curassoni TaxID=6186 RepID=A0A183KXL4_9TREM|nr:unnamed protein product [Schistosoma curassoni]
MHNNDKPGIHMSSELDKKRKAYRRCYSIQSDRSRQIHSTGNVILKSYSKIIDNETHPYPEHHQQLTQIKQKNQFLQQQQQQGTHSEYHYEEDMIDELNNTFLIYQCLLSIHLIHSHVSLTENNE